ncbi:uncharacterized protein Gasu_35860 [Galdieria sulphuraria]|uniref:Uncharacterized protein n=1 Tax=Galdieria sulphuraria TaxID=130081 RepID=M2W076_GALSU|nr:uncharacterized protein Gasu_35860 [Galdieria sulphuraria]EME29016.1 hypothetical protein Gasu_35860 [Galdieria sulphuraria]|eukprot:XP_005705536.1 hypothetical protein Gasu_35860 [Galdieria sulphuraria]
MFVRSIVVFDDLPTLSYNISEYLVSRRVVLVNSTCRWFGKNYRLTTSSILSSVLSFLLPSCTLVATTCPLRPIRPLNPESPILLLEKFRYRPNFAIYNHRGTVMYMNRYADAQ